MILLIFTFAWWPEQCIPFVTSLCVRLCLAGFHRISPNFPWFFPWLRYAVFSAGTSRCLTAFQVTQRISHHTHIAQNSTDLICSAVRGLSNVLFNTLAADGWSVEYLLGTRCSTRFGLFDWCRLSTHYCHTIVWPWPLVNWLVVLTSSTD